MKLNLVGKIVGTHGIKGEVKIKSDTDFNRFTIGNILYIEKDNKYEEIIISSHRIHKNYDLVTFNNLKSINDVLQYVNCDVFVDVSDLDELEEDEFYFDDLIGLKIVGTNYEDLGIVTDIIEVPQGILLEVKTNENKKALIPYVDEFIKKIDIEKEIIVINVIEGLL